ncbi:hypothetical protein A2W54_02735 [Candidatus Giovannonibacteria bacterium RIFCSPHIGHO2_02_43_13]|uniref:Uncharacterized protein n=1 Tax=Candidatus Giovannonibacteria bacterium RIFCSPHIGHO2_02_43_13 TaxID=1798330 RepID=A0A1F5WSS4_9BACT|nr:MAG: hypothetical protein A3E06_04025 [Candidatus Giovannonibacteria bacterium RIFCSPHIGHO2_12_FULL_44_42]OGF78677.1 MAG: hypothetical protein A2W54_02735 [Candidatus Giovannonibacteria bacterium RIFCSPHIGHO2_02_43_13]OGF97435.1 MAG: hypothetical protein A3H08_04130 [Candidatus Giovannonibacteria bacterium RIFCSPLOWO2_12_FULL_44_32]HLD34772.1 hypothetical protein [Patescibacteria group bacterium]
MFNLSVRMDIRAKDFESKAYFIIFGLVAALLALQIYNVAFGALVSDPVAAAQNLGVFRPHIENSDLGR